MWKKKFKQGIALQNTEAMKDAVECTDPSLSGFLLLLLKKSSEHNTRSSYHEPETNIIVDFRDLYLSSWRLLYSARKWQSVLKEFIGVDWNA